MKATKDILGKKAVDKITGIEGTVVNIAYWMNGCVRLQLQPYGQTGDGKPKDAIVVDQQDAELVPAPKKLAAGKKKGDRLPTGGPTDIRRTALPTGR